MVLWVFGYGSLIWKAGFDYDERRVGFIKGYRRLFHQGSTDHRGTPSNPGRTVTLEPRDGHTCNRPVPYKTGRRAFMASSVKNWLVQVQKLLNRHETGHLRSKTLNQARRRPKQAAPASFASSGSILITLWGVAYRVSGHEAEEIALSYLEVREKEYDQKAYVDFYFDEDSTEPAISGVLVYIASADKKSNKNYLGPAPLETIAHQIVGAVGPSGPNTEYLFHLETALQEIGCKDSHITDLANAVRNALTCKEGDHTSNGDAK